MCGVASLDDNENTILIPIREVRRSFADVISANFGGVDLATARQGCRTMIRRFKAHEKEGSMYDIDIVFAILIELEIPLSHSLWTALRRRVSVHLQAAAIQKSQVVIAVDDDACPEPPRPTLLDADAATQGRATRDDDAVVACTPTSCSDKYAAMCREKLIATLCRQDAMLAAKKQSSSA